MEDLRLKNCRAVMTLTCHLLMEEGRGVMHLTTAFLTRCPHQSLGQNVSLVGQ